jgi:predicted HD phosphohydrolase
LLHDVGDIVAPDNHSQVAAAMLQPYVSEATHWVIAHHGLFQGYYYYHLIGRDRDARERYRGHPHFQPGALPRPPALSGLRGLLRALGSNFV